VWLFIFLPCKVRSVIPLACYMHLLYGLLGGMGKNHWSVYIGGNSVHANLKALRAVLTPTRLCTTISILTPLAK
jgi:hypothetical protein